MHTPSLSRRLVAAGVTVVAVLVLGLDLLLCFALRWSLESNVSARLDSEVALVRAQAARGDLAGLSTRLASDGVYVTVRAPDGTVVGMPEASPVLHPPGPVVRRAVQLPSGAKVELSGSLADANLWRLIRLEAVVSPLVIALAFLLLRLIADYATRPVSQITAAARRTATGKRGERLRPHPTTTSLGQMASAYDEMLDSLEQALSEADRARALSESAHQRYHQIVATARDAFVSMDHAGRIVEWNEAAERTFGWSREEALGQEVVATVVPEDLREGYLLGLHRFGVAGLADRLSRTVTMRGRRRDGTVFPVEITVWTTERDGSTVMNAFVRDITERTRAEAQLARLAAIVESSDEAMYSTDTDGVIVTWNRGAEQMYGYSAHEVLGRKARRLSSPGRCVECWMPIKPALPRTDDGPRRRKDGEIIQVVSVVSAVVDESGSVTGVCAVERDVTTQRRLEAELHGTLAALEAAVAEAQSSEEAMRSFFDNAAHQLRSPITSIRASAETLLRGVGSPEERQRMLGAVVRESSRAGRQMAGVLQMSRLNKAPELDLRLCDVVALCRDEADRIFYVAPHLEVVVAAQPSMPRGGVVVDRHAVAEIVANLLDNAARHAGGRIEIDLASPERQWITVRVSDDGPGLPPGMDESCFERFVSLDGKGGSGLGLPIARALARAHGGELSYRDRAFVLCLPRAAASATHEQPPDTHRRLKTIGSRPTHS